MNELLRFYALAYSISLTIIQTLSECVDTVMLLNFNNETVRNVGFLRFLGKHSIAEYGK